MEKLRIGHRLLLALAFLGDVFENVADAGGIMSFSYKQVYGFVPQKYKRHNFYATVSRSLKIGNIQKEIKNGKVHLKLTSLGKEELLNQIPLLKLRQKSWDGKWLIIVFDIPEKQSGIRKAVREKLSELGFGMLQRSVWISPYDLSSLLKEFLENIGLSEKVLVIGPSKIWIKDDKALAFKIFGLEKINQAYEKLLEKWEERKEGEEEKLAKEIKSCYLDILSVDPFLPEALLPRDWRGREAAALVERLIKVG